MPEISLVHWPVCSRDALWGLVLPWDSLDAQTCPMEPCLSKNSVALPWIRPSFVLGHSRGPLCPGPVASWKLPGRSGSLEAPNSESLWDPSRRGMSHRHQWHKCLSPRNLDLSITQARAEHRSNSNSGTWRCLLFFSSSKHYLVGINPHTRQASLMTLAPQRGRVNDVMKGESGHSCDEITAVPACPSHDH